MLPMVRREPRIVSQFSCGAASPVATKLILAQFPAERVVILRAWILEEHEDDRFSADCERWFNLFRDRKTGERYSLRNLPPNKGRHHELEISCSAFCLMAEEDFTAPDQPSTTAEQKVSKPKDSDHPKTTPPEGQ